MSVFNLLKLPTIGAGLITSSSLWFFGSGSTTPAITLRSSPSKSPHWKGLPNSYSTIAPRVATIIGETIKETKLKPDLASSTYPSSGIYFTLEGSEKKKYLSVIQQELEDFKIGYVYATLRQYTDYKIDEINISLFTKPAWESSQNKEEYEKKLTRDEINGLFQENLDKVKVKQLLLSLHKRLEWVLQNDGEYTSYYSQVTILNSLSDLKDLKIKHFTDYEKLKNYVKQKVEKCIGEEVACFPSVEELDVRETDKKSFFENITSRKK